ncbi:Serine/threonine-protein kinase TOR [Capsicum baccatum]|uniref:Serine/threonine-protein kinase TOR n=1 Tax=Capsicum baccatum TaxID=33114 RepID=A0A2G2V4U1_CAPBA|nr:Serine/threonine-protein kinase TOR [Capsicum baccatum]
MGALRAINELIDVTISENTSKVVKFSNYMRAAYETKRDPEILVLYSKVLGHLVRSGGAMTVDEVERQVKVALEWLRGKRIDYRRFAAALILKEMVENASTGFNVHVPEFVDAIWVALKDPTLAVREKAVEALRACLQVIEKCETRWRVQWSVKRSMGSKSQAICYPVATTGAENIDALNRVLADLCTRSNPKDGTALTLRRLVEEEACDLRGEAFAHFMDHLYERITTFLDSNEVSKNLGALRAIDELIDVIISENASKVAKFSNDMRATFETNRDPEILVLASKVLGHLSRSGDAMTADEVERQVKAALEWLHGERIKYRRLAAVLILKYYRMFEATQDGLGRNTPVQSIHRSLLVVGKLLRKTREFMMSRYREVAEIVLRYLEHRGRLVRLSITSLLPRIAHFLHDRFICMNHILHVLKIPAERASGFIALGEMAGALDGELINYLPTLTSHLHDVIAPRRGRTSLEALACVRNISKVMGPTMETHVRGLLDSMFSSGLSLLEQITKSIPPLLPTNQNRLLECISAILSRSHHLMLRQSASFSLILDLELHGHDLLEFARESVVVYLEDEDGATRIDATLCCCKLVANSFSAISFTQFSPSRFNHASGKRRRRLVEEENESKAAKLKSPAKGSKNFMSMTISPSSEITQSRKKKILEERNDPVRTSITLCDDSTIMVSNSGKGELGSFSLSWGFDEQENESKAEKLKSPSKGSKNFMSLTISTSSKIAQSRKKKILVERNDPVRTSITLSDGKATFFSANSEEHKQNSKKVMEPKETVSVDGLPLVTKTPKRVRFSEASLNFESLSDTVTMDSDICNHEPLVSPAIASLDADPSLPPYDPKTIYLSPRKPKLDDCYLFELLSENLSDIDGSESSLTNDLLEEYNGSSSEEAFTEATVDQEEEPIIHVAKQIDEPALPVFEDISEAKMKLKSRSSTILMFLSLITGSKKLDKKFEPIELEEDEESETKPDEEEFQMDADLDDSGEVEIEGVDVLEKEKASAVQLAEVHGADRLEKDVEQGEHDLVETEKVSVVPAEGNESDSSERDLDQGLTSSNAEV